MADDGYIKIYGKLKSVTESGKVADYSAIDGAPDAVQANPTDDGTVTLTKLKVGETVYNVPQGGSSSSEVTSTSYVVNSLSSVGSIPSTEIRAIYIGGNATSTTAITIPTTVNEIDFNGATITINVTSNDSFAIKGHANTVIKNLNLVCNLKVVAADPDPVALYAFRVITGFGGVENVRVTINKATGSDLSIDDSIIRGFYSCDHLVNCKVEHNFTTDNASPQTVAYAYCNYLVWCRLSGYTTFGFAECNYLTNCAVYKGVAESPYYNCNDLTNCTYYDGENQISKSTVSKLTVGGSPLDIIPQANSGSNSKAYVKPAGGTGIALIEISQSQEDSLSIARRTSDGRLRGKRAISGYDLTPLAQVNEELAKKVDKVEGKDLSTNDFTDDEMTKLAGIETGAEVNEINTITAGENVTVSKSDKTVTISATGGNARYSKWLLNTTISTTGEKIFTAGEFYCGSNNFDKISINSSGYVYYSLTGEDLVDVYTTSWVSSMYRTITFETAPSGELLTWLKANGTQLAVETITVNDEAISPDRHKNVNIPAVSDNADGVLTKDMYKNVLQVFIDDALMG